MVEPQGSTRNYTRLPSTNCELKPVDVVSNVKWNCLQSAPEINLFVIYCYSMQSRFQKNSVNLPEDMQIFSFLVEIVCKIYFERI